MNAPRPAERGENAPHRISVPVLTERERRTGLVLAGVAGLAFFALSGGRALFLGIGLAMAGALGFASHRRSRLGAAFAAMVTTFGPWSFAAVFGAPYAIFAFWLLARGRRLMDPAPPGRSGGTRAARRGGGRVT